MNLIYGGARWGYFFLPRLLESGLICRSAKTVVHTSNHLDAAISMSRPHLTHFLINNQFPASCREERISQTCSFPVIPLQMSFSGFFQATTLYNGSTCTPSIVTVGSVLSVAEGGGMLCSSVLKKRRKKMNKHKYKKWLRRTRIKRRRLKK